MPLWMKIIAGIVIFIAIIATFANATNKRPYDGDLRSANEKKACQVNIKIEKTENGNTISLFSPLGIKYICSPTNDGASCKLP